VPTGIVGDVDERFAQSGDRDGSISRWNGTWQTPFPVLSARRSLHRHRRSFRHSFPGTARLTLARQLRFIRLCLILEDEAVQFVCGVDDILPCWNSRRCWISSHPLPRGARPLPVLPPVQAPKAPPAAPPRRKRPAPPRVQPPAPPPPTPPPKPQNTPARTSQTQTSAQNGSPSLKL